MEHVRKEETSDVFSAITMSPVPWLEIMRVVSQLIFFISSVFVCLLASSSKGVREPAM